MSSTAAGKAGRVGVTGVLVADEGHGECGSGGGGHVSWIAFGLACALSWFLRSGSRKSGSELRKAGATGSGSLKLVSRLADASGASTADAPFMPVRRQCSSRALRAIERIAAMQNKRRKH